MRSGCPAVVPLAGRLLAVDRLGSGGLHGPGLRVLDPDLQKFTAAERHHRAAEVRRRIDQDRRAGRGHHGRKGPPAVRRLLEQRNPAHAAAEAAGPAGRLPAADRQASIPPRIAIAEGYWHGFAARARVLIVNTKLVASRTARLRFSIWPIRMARPGGDGQAAVRHHRHARRLPVRRLGRPAGRGVLPQAQRNEVQIVSGNKQVAMAVGGGRADFGLTDTDDALIEVEKGMPVAIVYPDQQPGGLGTLFIPNTLAIIRGCPHPAAARQLVDYLLRPRWKRCWPPAPAPRFR